MRAKIFCTVSTHSRLKAAGGDGLAVRQVVKFQHTAA